jgi:hypothetical protein
MRKTVEQFFGSFLTASANRADFGGLLKLFPIVRAVLKSGFNILVRDAEAMADNARFFF